MIFGKIAKGSGKPIIGGPLKTSEDVHVVSKPGTVDLYMDIQAEGAMEEISSDIAT